MYIKCRVRMRGGRRVGNDDGDDNNVVAVIVRSGTVRDLRNR